MAESKSTSSSIVTATLNHHHQDSDTTTLMLSSILRNIDLKIKQIPNFFNNLGQEKKKEVSNFDAVVVVNEERAEIPKKPSGMVRFSNTRPNIPPLELEAEEPAGRTSNKVVLWQVYAITGFMVLRWVAARWNERKERKAKEDNDQTQTRTDDINAQSEDNDQTQTRTDDSNAQ